jgi:hypothetical protein
MPSDLVVPCEELVRKTRDTGQQIMLPGMPER